MFWMFLGFLLSPEVAARDVSKHSAQVPSDGFCCLYYAVQLTAHCSSRFACKIC